MTKLEHCLENAIVALEEGKDFDTWLYEERGRGNIHAWGNSDAVLTDASVIDVKDIWELASYVQFVVVQNVKSAGYNKWLKENPYILGIDLDRSQKADRLEPEHIYKPEQSPMCEEWDSGADGIKSAAYDKIYGDFNKKKE